ncbi:hypothetical protein [Streptomyces sp. NPDC006552]|uniref:hypothetical protein n=1 Tax=Streptomyces sp. NPDC006552 TaxID=3157179 RepID=UPI0033B9C274
MTAAQRAMTELGTWPDLASGPPRCSVGHAFGAAGHELVHFEEHDAHASPSRPCDWERPRAS